MAEDIQAFETKGPPLEYTKMGDAYAEPKEEQENFGSDMRGLEKAAEALEQDRAEPETIQRRYVQIGGEADGEGVPENQTIDLKRAVDDLTRQRNFEHAVAEDEGANLLANAVDTVREQAALPQLDAQQQQQQAQPDVQPQIAPEHVPPGVDIEVVQALQNNPKLRQAVEQEVIKADHARQQFAVATQQAAQIAVASVLADYPELSGLNAAQIPAALQVLQVSNPERHAAVVGHLNRAEALHKMAQQAQVQNAQAMQAQIQFWSAEQDKAVDRHLASEPPETVRAVKDNLVKVASEVYGIDRHELAHAFATTPILRAAPFQRMLYDLVKGHIAKAQMAQKKVPANIPHVQKPGVREPRPTLDQAEASRAREAFMRNPTAKSAAAYLAAKRSAQ